MTENISPEEVPESGGEQAAKSSRTMAVLVHLLTASGLIFIFLAMVEITTGDPSARWVLFWLLMAVLVDAIDGPLARRYRVKEVLPSIDGRKIDDLIDYLSFTFVPLLFVWRMNWLPEPAGVWVVIAMIASVFGFANVRSKQEEQGFFLGFPSYWNIYAYYAGLWVVYFSKEVNLAILLLFSVLTILPIRFVYLNLARQPWKGILYTGGVLWALLLGGMLPWYSRIPSWLMWVTLIYPMLYIAISIFLDIDARGRKKTSKGEEEPAES